MLIWANPVWNIKRKVTIGAVQVCLTPKGAGICVFFRKEKGKPQNVLH